MLSNKKILSAIAILLLTNDRSAAALQFKSAQLQSLHHKDSLRQHLDELFDDNNFETEFVDTTNDQDTLPLAQQVTTFEEDPTQQAMQAIAKKLGVPVDSGDEAAQKAPVPEQQQLVTKSTDDDRTADTVGSSGDTDIEESVTEVAAKAKKEADEAGKAAEQEEREEKQEEAKQAEEAKQLKKQRKNSKADDYQSEVKSDAMGADTFDHSGHHHDEIGADAFDEKKPKVTHAEDPKKVSRELEQEEKLKKSIEKINANIDESKKALEKHTAHVKELKEMVRQQNEGSAAKHELDNVLSNAEKHVHDLESHIKKGEKLVDDKDKELDKVERDLNETNQADRAQGKDIKQSNKLKREEDAKKKETEVKEKEKKKPIAEVSIKSIEQSAKKAHKNIGKNEVKAHKAQSAAKRLLPEVDKAKKQVERLEAITAQTREGSAREEKMKNITAKAKERLAAVEKKVSKQLTKEMKARDAVTKNTIELDKAKEDYKAKHADNKDVREAKLAAQGLIHSRPGSASKPDYVVEGENAIKYVKYVNESADAFTTYHRTAEDPREWRKPQKEEKEYDIEEDKDPNLYNNKKPWSKKKSIMSPRKKITKQNARPQVTESKQAQQQSTPASRPIAAQPATAPVAAVAAPMPTRRSSSYLPSQRQASSRPLNEVQPVQRPVAAHPVPVLASSQHEAEAHHEQRSQQHHKKHKKHKKRHHKRHHSHHKKHHSHGDHLTQTQSNIAIDRKRENKKKEQQPAAPSSPVTMGELMANPSIQQLLDNNNEYWQHKIDSQTNAFKKKIAKMEQLFQKDKTESDKEHKAFLKKMKKSEKV